VTQSGHHRFKLKNNRAKEMNKPLAAITILTLIGCGESSNQPSSTHTDEEAAASPAIVGEEIAYEVDGISMNGYLAYDRNQTGERPGVLIVHEWWGHNDYVRRRADMLAELGYTGFALDMYGDHKQANHPADAQKFMMEVLNNMPAGESRFRAARKLLEEHVTTDESRTAAVGYCFGGGVVLHMARLGADLKGVASFHGSLATATPAEAGSISAKLLVAHGADDPFVPAAELEAFKQEMADAGADMKFIAYPGAVHAFTNPAATAMGEKHSLPLAYNETADTESWAELKSFLQDVFTE
jgi:dienelactone hydrolase